MDGFTIAPFPDQYLNIFNSYVPDFIGNENTLNFTCLVVGIVAVIIFVVSKFRNYALEQKEQTQENSLYSTLASVAIFSIATLYVTYKLAAYRGIPLILIYLVLIIFVYHYYTTKTVPGRYLYAVGGNEKAAKLSGVDTESLLQSLC